MELVTSESAAEAADPDPAAAAEAARPARGGPLPGRPLYVPVRTGAEGGTHLRFARTPGGARTAVGFTSRKLLAEAFGDQQPWVLLAEPALRALAEPLGAAVVTVDPRAAAAPRTVASPRTAAGPACARRVAVGSPAVSFRGTPA
ncbi:SAV_915 family protein [Streptomyces tremellae]|uniref:SseB protein N-terminal domain-containing protein n=1 Tax=Streptomyces tremellae TaxID=1124239 RepID=A0ABP7GEB8_9ACTN